MWKYHAEKIGDTNVTRYTITKEEKAASFQEVIDGWRSSSEFRNFFTGLLRNSLYEGFFWEVKPVTTANLQKEFEFVLVNSSLLPGIQADQSAFAEHFKTDQLVVSFSNLVGDARLIVPTEMSDATNYNHLAAFVRTAPSHQVEKFWQVVGEEYARAINDTPKWLSTAGLGVYWLHVRIDSRPKYYRYSEYKLIR